MNKSINGVNEIAIPVTILTVSFNAEATISRTIESVMNQTYPDIEYIVIDGASKDNTVKVAESYLEAFNARPHRSMRIISEPDNGMYDALNKGARLAHGEIVGQINADDWYEPYAVETMAELYERENYDLAWGSLNVITAKRRYIKHAKRGLFWSTSHWCHPAAFAKREALLQYPYPLTNSHDDFDFATHLYVDGKKLIPLDKVISNFTFGGMSTKKSIREAKKRLDEIYGIHRKYGMSRLYYIYRLMFEGVKYILT
ncbi:MAG: glycosyltransferase [Synergistaceae bacterium]|nr:glycosyltransferase [Synergistaceae bacterium]MBQ4401574.1 glycosyltransferase [Synergistaceae bacterium]